MANSNLMDQPQRRPFRGTFEIPTLNFLKIKLGNHGSKFSKTEWNAYFSQYFAASKC